MMTKKMNSLWTQKQRTLLATAETFGRYDLAEDSLHQTWLDLERWAPNLDEKSNGEIINYFKRAVERRARKDSMQEEGRLDHVGYFIEKLDDDGDPYEEERVEMGDTVMVNTIDEMLDVDRALEVGVITSREYEALYGVVVEKLNQTEVAARMGITQGRVSQLVRAAQEKLNAFLTLSTAGGAE